MDMSGMATRSVVRDYRFILYSPGEGDEREQGQGRGGDGAGEERDGDRLDVSVDDLWCITVTSSPAHQLSSQQRIRELQTLHWHCAVETC